MELKHPRYYHDEVWNTLTHGFGFILVLVGGAVLLYQAYLNSFIDLLAVAIYIGGAMFVYGSSTAYHAVPPGRLKDRLNKIDHISIFFMIAGSHMPIILRFFNNTEGYIFLAVLWSLVLIGIVIKVFFMETTETLSIILYIVMGCLSIFLYPELSVVLSPSIIGLLVAGGLFYLVGVIFYVWESLPYNHPIWHVFVLAGSVAHFIAIYFLVLS